MALAALAGFAQAKPGTKTTAAPASANKGHNINVTVAPLRNTKVYLGSYYGNTQLLVDSTFLNDKSQGVFKGPAKYTGGIYFIVTMQPRPTIQFEFLMDKSQQFSISGDTAMRDKFVVTGSPENDLFKSYATNTNAKGYELSRREAELATATTKADSLRVRGEYLKAKKDLDEYRDNIVKKNPGSLLAALLSAMKYPNVPPVPVVNGKADSLYPYHFVKDHFWDDVAFNDDRLLRTPFFEKKLETYFKEYVSPDPDSVIREVNYILLSARTGKEIYPFLLTKFTNKYMTPEYMGQDKVFVFLFENFYAKGDTVLLNPASRKTVTDRAYSLMANQLGQPAPALDLTDTSGKTSSLYSINAPFTVVAFWDPNCGHCKEEIPRLDSIYKSKWRSYGVAVYSVNIYENEIPAWKKFIQEKGISSEWKQAYETKEARSATEKAGKPNYRQLYDISKTPTLYLLDKDKRIIAKQLSLSQFDDLIEAKRKAK